MSASTNIASEPSNLQRPKLFATHLMFKDEGASARPEYMSLSLLH
jgi:hypothetical protein